MRGANAEALVVALEPANSAAISHGKSGSFKIQGWGGFVPPLYRPDEVDHVLAIEDEAASEMTLRLAREEAIFTGISGGANVAGASRSPRAAPGGRSRRHPRARLRLQIPGQRALPAIRPLTRSALYEGSSDVVARFVRSPR